MKLVKLSLIAALAAGSLTALSAVSLDEAIRDIDVSGELRYRYDSGRYDNYYDNSAFSHGINTRQNHHFRARIGAMGEIADGFKVFGQLQYGNTTEGGYGSSSTTNTSSGFNVRQAYLQYDSAFNTSTILGKQQLGTIWTQDMVGMAAKGLYTGIEGLTLAAFAVDSFEQDGDRSFRSSAYQGLRYTRSTDAGGNIVYSDNFEDFFWKKDAYGVAGIASYDLGFGTIDPQLWLMYVTNRAFFYALDAKYAMDFGNLNWGLQFTYLGNSIEDDLQQGLKARLGLSAASDDPVEDGNLFNLQGTLKGYGFDGTLGGIYYGKKGKFSVQTLDDVGQIGLEEGSPAGEVFYTAGSDLTNSYGQSTFAYLRAGYTFADQFRIGVKFIYGGTKTGGSAPITALEYMGGGDKMEYLVEAKWNYTKALNFWLWYSNLNIDPDANAAGATEDTTKQTVRFQATYKF